MAFDNSEIDGQDIADILDERKAEARVKALADDEDNNRRFEDHNEYFNAQFTAKPHYVDPGQTLCGEHAAEMIIATPGAGVIVTIHDIELKVGGLAYVLLPKSVLEHFPHLDRANQNDLKKAFEPIEECISSLKRMGAGKNRIRIRLIGATNMPNDVMDCGTKNYIFVKNYLASKGLKVMSEDMSGDYLRRVHFFPHTGRAVRRILRRDSDFEAITEKEKKFEEFFLN